MLRPDRHCPREIYDGRIISRFIAAALTKRIMSLETFLLVTTHSIVVFSIQLKMVKKHRRDISKLVIPVNTNTYIIKKKGKKRKLIDKDIFLPKLLFQSFKVVGG